MILKNEDGVYVIFTDTEYGNANAIIGIATNFLKQIYGEKSKEVEDYVGNVRTKDINYVKRLTLRALPGLIKFGKTTDYHLKKRK